MKNFTLFLLLSLAILINSSCAKRLASFEKRRYTKGYHIDIAQKKINKNMNSTKGSVEVIPEQEINKPVNETIAIIYSTNNNHHISEEKFTSEKQDEHLNSVDKNKISKNNPLIILGKVQLTKTVKNHVRNIIPQRNTAGTDFYGDYSSFIALGIVTAVFGIALLIYFLLFSKPVLIIGFAVFIILLGAALIIIEVLSY